jgi:NAD(P)-dependent dehydrogenase (short-subunit alcohol dehydrogenase family)
MWKNMGDMFTPDQLEKVAKSLPLRRVGRPVDIANLVVFLSSPAASYITGQVVSASGGYSMIG